jgi:hypothetical protein
MWKLIILLCCLALLAFQKVDHKQRDILLSPDDPEINRVAPDVFNIKLETTKGTIRLELHRAWSPHGVDRFYNLVRNHYYERSIILRR